MKDFYFFYCIKESTDDEFLNPTEFKNVIKVEAEDKKKARELAKEIMFSKHPDVPRSFRKTTSKYFYLTDTYKSQYLEIDFECKMCGKVHLPYKGINDWYIKNGFCDFICYNRYKKLKEEIYKNELSAYLDEDYNSEFISNQTSDTKGYIYLITNKITEKVYVGQTAQIPIFRWWQHIKSDVHKFERRDLTDIKFEVLEIIEASNSTQLKKKLFEREDYYIRTYNSLVPNGYNLMNAKKREKELRQLILDLDLEERNKENE